MTAQKDILPFAEEIARGAGKILMTGFRSKDTVISYKSKTDLVTNMDRASEDYLCGEISRTFPDHTIVAEEGGGRQAGGEYIWYVDPLDATNNYAHGLAPFCVSIGVWSRAENGIIAGVVYDPYHKELFRAEKGGGAFLNGSPIKVSETEDLGISILATGFPYDKGTSKENNLRQFNAFLPRIQGVRRMGSAAMDLCFVACGRMDGYWEMKLKPWDQAAGSLIVSEAGGSVSGFSGQSFDPEVPEVLASNGRIHSQMMEIFINI